MTEFDKKVDEIVERTGAGTDAFKDNVNKRFRLILKITAINSVIFLLNFLAILYSLWPGDAFKTLAGFIFLLSAATIVMGLVGLFVVWLSGYAYNQLAERKKKRSEEKEALRERRREEFYKIAEQHVAIRNAMDKGLKISDLTMWQMIEMYNEDRKEETIQAAIKELGMTREEAIEKGFIYGLTQVAIESRCRKESKKLGREITARDLFELDRERLRNSPYPGPDCIEPWEAEEYVKSNKWPGKDMTSHIGSCVGCNMMVNGMRPVQYPPPGPDCYTQAELDQVVQTGNLPDGRLDHKNSCQQCKNKLSSAQSDFINKLVPDQSFHPTDLDMDFGD